MYFYIILLVLFMRKHLEYLLLRVYCYNSTVELFTKGGNSNVFLIVVVRRDIVYVSIYPFGGLTAFVSGCWCFASQCFIV